MNHQPIEDDLTAYVDGELSELDMQRVKAALAADPKLSQLEQSLRRTVASVEALPSPLPSQALRRAVMNGLDAPMTVGERLQKWMRPSRLMPALGMAAAAALIALIAHQGAQVAPPEEEQLFVAQNLEVLEDLDLAGLESAEDLEVIDAMNSLEGTP